jgi:hypothetical protein
VCFAGRVRRYSGDIPPASWLSLLSLQKVIAKMDHLCMTIDLEVRAPQREHFASRLQCCRCR